MATIMVTGAAGFIGSNVTRTFLEEGHFVYGVDSFITGSRTHIDELSTHDKFTFYEKDISEPNFPALFADTKIDAIYHLACPTGVPNLRILATEMMHACSYGMFNVLEVARTHKAKFLFTSTAEMYGQPERFPQDEEYYGNVNPIGERSPYEEGKRFAEAALVMYVRVHSLDARIVRVFNTYGPGMSLNDRRVIPQFLRSIIAGEPLTVYGDGSQSRSHLYVDDLLHGLRLVMEKGVPGEAYNIGSETPMSVGELGRLVIELSGYKGHVEFKPHFIEDHHARRPSVEKVKQLGWRQDVPIHMGLRRMIDLYIPAVEVEKVADVPLPEQELTISPAAA